MARRIGQRATIAAGILLIAAAPAFAGTADMGDLPPPPPPPDFETPTDAVPSPPASPPPRRPAVSRDATFTPRELVEPPLIPADTSGEPTEGTQRPGVVQAGRSRPPGT